MSRERDIFLEASGVGMEFRAAGAPVAIRQSSIGARLVRRGHGIAMQALDGVNFRLEHGESLALIGHNGAGKTTLLRVLAGIFQPSTGEISAGGRIGNALNINLGFRNEATGRRNIEIKALMGGCKRQELPAFVENVAAFADLGTYLDAPLRTYSAGMRARLAFGIATAHRYDILLLDEWLGAGDRTMQALAQERMAQMVADSAILVMASHVRPLLTRNCKYGLVLDHGRQVYFGPVREALKFYDEGSNA